MRVTTAEFIENCGSLADKALFEPVTITADGRDRLVLLSAEAYARLMRRDRRVVAAGDLTEEDLALIAQAEVPAEYGYLDEEFVEAAGCKPSFVAFMRASPLTGIELDIERDRSPPRDVDL